MDISLADASRLPIYSRITVHPTILEYYTPVTTSPDGNCLFNAISICLSGSENLSATLRVVASFTILKNIELFERWLHQGESIFELLKTAWTRSEWGNEYHLQALCMALKRPVYQYTGFTNANGNVHFANATTAELQQYFVLKAAGTAQHLVYKFMGQANRAPIACILQHQHFTALLPNRKDVIKFEPHTQFFRVGEE